MKARSKVPARPSSRSASRLRGEADPDLDPVRDPGRGPGAPADLDRLGIGFERDQAAVSGQGERHGERAVASEATDLEHAPGAGQLDQQSHELTLLGRDLHAGAGQPRGLFAAVVAAPDAPAANSPGDNGGAARSAAGSCGSWSQRRARAASSTSATWPGTVTLLQTLRTLPSRSIRIVDAVDAHVLPAVHALLDPGAICLDYGAALVRGQRERADRTWP